MATIIARSRRAICLMNRCRLLLVLSMLLSASVAFGQEKVSFCFNDGELIGEKWREADGVTMEDKVHRSPFYGFVFNTDDEQLRAILRDQAFYVLYKDTLYINCRRAISEGTNYYAKAERSKKTGMVYFVSGEGGGVNSGVVVTAGLAGGIIGGALAGAAIGATRGMGAAPYLWSMEDGTPIRLTPKTMKKLLADKKELLKQYKAEDKKRQSAPECVYDYLRQLRIF